MEAILTSINEFAPDHQFWAGSVFRIMGSKANRPWLQGHFYDYMLVKLATDDKEMVVINVTQNSIKAGYVITYIRTAEINNQTVTAQEVRRSIGDEDVYYVSY